MRARAGAGVAGAVMAAVAMALLAAPGDTAAKGARRSGGSGSGKALSKSEVRPPAGGNHLTIRGRDTASAEDDAAPAQASVEPEAARKAAAERDPSARDARERMEAKLAAQRAEEERAEAARRAAADERRNREQSTANAEAERILERARNDHPVLRTPEGEPILRSILARQKILQERGMYPSIAMVEAVADHSDALRPRVRAAAAPTAPEAPVPDYSKTYGNCRWETPYTWSCK